MAISLHSFNPFNFSIPARGDAFLDRQRVLRQVVGTVNQGGSVALTAEPRMGKTSVLLYLGDHVHHLFGSEAERLTFCWLDGHTFGGWDVIRFWREALAPVRSASSQVQSAYARAEASGFDAQALNGLFRALQNAGRHMVLLIDEFDAVFSEPGLHQQRFYGPLRSLASFHPSLSLVIAARRSMTEMNYATREFAAGSPYFNFFQEVALGPFSEEDVNTLLGRAGNTFSAEDRAFLSRVAGAHPYLLQTAAYYLWEEYQAAKKGRTSPTARREKAALSLLEQARSTLEDSWRNWTTAMRKAFTVVALDNFSTLLGKRVFDIDRGLLGELHNFLPELRKLERLGFLRADNNMASNYTPAAEVMVWYLAEALVVALRDGDKDLARWLAAQEWDGMMTKGEKQALMQALTQVARTLSGLMNGVVTLIKAAAALRSS